LILEEKETMPSSGLSEYEECLREMFSLRRFGIKLGLETIRHLLTALGNPQDRFRTVHVAGTNGKGSVASALATILRISGYRTGLFTSPHLVRFNERIQIDGREIEDRHVMSAYRALQEIDSGGREPTFFEINTAMAFSEFARQAVDWAVIETGMGGRLDATNVLRPSLAIITNISLEHKMYLGGTVAKIAAEKAGIIKNGVPVVTGVHQQSALREVEHAADKSGSQIYQLGRDFSFRRNRQAGTFTYKGMDTVLPVLRTGLAGEFQALNASLTCAACESLRRQGVAIPDEAVYQGLAENHWPGRLEKVFEHPLVILDGAHNLAAARALGRYMETELADRRIILVSGILDDKPYKEILANLCRPASRAVLTRARIGRALPPETLEPVARRFLDEVTLTPTVAEAMDLALKSAGENDVVVVAGSLYVVGEAKEYFNSLEAQR
jgi:dihydrofolate synthase/folylpolyglutamate synthase